MLQKCVEPFCFILQRTNECSIQNNSTCIFQSLESMTESDLFQNQNVSPFLNDQQSLPLGRTYFSLLTTATV